MYICKIFLFSIISRQSYGFFDFGTQCKEITCNGPRLPDINCEYNCADVKLPNCAPISCGDKVCPSPVYPTYTCAPLTCHGVSCPTLNCPSIMMPRTNMTCHGTVCAVHRCPDFKCPEITCGPQICPPVSTNILGNGNSVGKEGCFGTPPQGGPQQIV